MRPAPKGEECSAMGGGAFEIPQALAELAPLWEAVGMAMKRTKADKAQRQADELESKSERRPAQVPKKTVTRENSATVAARSIREATKEG